MDNVSQVTAQTQDSSPGVSDHRAISDHEMKCWSRASRQSRLRQWERSPVHAQRTKVWFYFVSVQLSHAWLVGPPYWMAQL